MVNEWPIVALSDYCLKIGSGATPRGGSSVYKESGETFLIRSQNIHNDGFRPEGLVYIEREAATKLQNVIVEQNDILLNITGDSVARVCLARREYLPSRVNQHVAIIRPNPKEFDARYLRYVLSSPYMQKVLLNLASAGATRNALTKVMIETFKVSKPALQIQVTIADCLESLDNKIQLNRQTNQTLEKMAQTLFKSWFVDFDPVFDNALVNANYQLENLPADFPDELRPKAQQRLSALQNNSDKTCLEQKESNRAFPSEFEFNEQLGWIPKGWNLSLSGKVIDVRDGTHDSPKKSPSGFPLVTSRHITTGVLDLSSAYNISKEDYQKVNARSKVDSGDILLTMIGTVGIPYLVIDTHVNYAIKNVGLFKTSSSQYIKNYFFLLLKSPLMQNYLEARMAGTTQKYLSLKVLRNITFLEPPKNILQKFNGVIDSINLKSKSNLDQMQVLKNLRDTLLPKLISGELTLPDIEKLTSKI